MSSSIHMRVFLLCALLMLASQCTATMTEAEFKKMKIKDLRQFLSDRGLTCPGCQEKSDFVRMAFQHRDKSPVASKEKREVPKAKFWDAWSATMKHECEESVNKRGQDPSAEPYSSVCSTLELSVESFMMQHGKAVARKLKKNVESLLKTSYKDVYYDAGVVITQKLVDHCLASPTLQSQCQSLGFVVKLMEGTSVSDFKGWVTNVGIENTNVMYDIIGENGDL